ncbi:MAG: exodeoxyribonuclease VII large subunit, partial [Bacteroidetes bacterium]|nr:exodeoxyribonuclease VII large subunit [Bacteroidota bacterium]
PVISAVGHEVDFSISDFVADARAATPTQAAMIAAPDINDLRLQVDDYTSFVERHVKEKIGSYKEYVERLAYSHALLNVRDRMVTLRTRINTLTETLQYRQEKRIMQNRSNLQSILHQLDKMNPNEPLERGFARVWQDEQWVRSKAGFSDKEEYDIEWNDGRIAISAE